MGRGGWLVPTNWFEEVLKNGALLKVDTNTVHIVLHVVEKSGVGITESGCGFLELVHYTGLWVEASSHISLCTLDVVTGYGKPGNVSSEDGGLVVY